MDENEHNFAVDVKEIILTHDGTNTGTETFVYEPSNIEEEAFGNLYIIGWLQNKRHELEFLPNLVASVVRREFYAVDKRTAEEHFESALKKANATLLDINKTNKDIIRDVHFCIVNIVGETVRLCAFGDMIALLYRNGEITDMRQRSSKKQGKTELFSDVITGTVAEGDSIMLGTKPVTDLFSDKGFLKLFSLPLAEQSEIITKIYQKNAREALLPDQALVLIAVQGILGSRWTPFKKNTGKRRIDASPVAHERALDIFTTTAKKTGEVGTALYRHAREIPTMSVRKRNARILFSLFAGIIVFGSVYAMINAQFMSLRVLEQRIEAARAASDAAVAVELLTSVQRDAILRIPSLLTSTAAENIFHAANTDLNALFGIHITPPLFITRIPTASISFSPSFIFDDETFIYIFSRTPDTVARISKKDGTQRFLFLSGAPADFTAERMVKKEKEFYFVNDTKKTAVRWHTEGTMLAETKRPTDKSSVNERNSFGAHYSLKGTTIVRTADNDTQEKYLAGTIPPLTDFTVSHDNTALYLLSQNMVFGLRL